MSLLIMSDSDDEIIETTRVYDEGYKAGLRDAWNAAKEIAFCNQGELCKIFPQNDYDDHDLGWLDDYTPFEAIGKLKVYKENYAMPRQNAIKSHLRNLLNEYTSSEIKTALYGMENTDGKEN